MEQLFDFYKKGKAKNKNRIQHFSHEIESVGNSSFSEKT